MNLLIHRGTNEIGGTCIELRAGNTRILLDFGTPLMDSFGNDFNERKLQDKSVDGLVKEGALYPIEGLYSGSKPQVDAILISHSHKDHYGFIKYANPEIPVYISDGARKLIFALNKFIHPKSRVNIDNCRVVKHKQSVDIGDFKIIPYLVDHSGFDAMSYHIIDKTSGKSIFYSGDFRATGWKRDIFDRFIANPPKGVDYLLMEGTMMGREGGKYPDEPAVVEKIEEIISASENNIVLSYVSGQNIDRLVTFYKAIRKTKSLLVLDPYTAYVLHAIRTPRDTIPQADWPNVKVLVANYFHEGDIYMNKIGRSDPEFMKMVGNHKIKTYELSKLDCKALVLMRNTMIPVISRIRGIFGSTLVYSQWDGYLKKDNKETRKFKAFVDRYRLDVKHVHTSGHATESALKTFADEINPSKGIIPIHTMSPQSFKRLFGDKVLTLSNGKTLEI